ncbi:copper-translocating P-type ATPase [Bacillus sp. FJAT-49711]|uniref:heavy metal translocating P-type ATPase n=1 Tax=Bacillus sp. FJAT-49711 TaxID=2833585 RepID=UPI001BC984B0|nr:heavy metal translocating P-type ATPase [Bacillus sp. FJAT-49711]MBS4219384.1 copper-translocating P-type ATPase [Bacillus sp. FJAT-49711]
MKNSDVSESQFQITGMTCAACSNRIEKGLNKLEGVKEANVNLALEKANILYDKQKISVEDIQKKVKDLGYDIVTEKVELIIKGMTCAACSTRIEKGLKKMGGVLQANVNLALEQAMVEFNPSVLTTKDLTTRVKHLGYGAIVKKEEGDKETVDYREREIKNQERKFFLSLLLTLPLLWTMASHFSFTSFVYVPKWLMNPWVQMAIATPVQFYIGKQFYVAAFKALRNHSANMDVLVVLGTSAAYFYSVFIAIRSIGNPGHSIDLYFETSAVLITLIILGKLFEAKAKGRSSQAIKKLMRLQAKTATVVRQDAILDIPLEEVEEGDILLVKPGEKVPVDGTIIEGQAAFDESMITGESVPVDKKAGDTVIGATINKNGFIKIQATKVGKETALAQIIKVVETAQGSKAPIQRLADYISSIFVPIVVGIAILTFIIWFTRVAPGNFPEALEKMISVLVIACPCALGLATPTSIMAGSGRAAEYGILFKGGEHLETTHKVDTVILDKTGTVTNGTPVLTNISTSLNETEFLSLIGSAEQQSEHPLAEAIVEGIKKKKVLLKHPSSFEAIPGFGIKAVIGGKEIIVGTKSLMKKNNVVVEEALDKINRYESEGKTAMLAAVDRKYAGIVAVADTIKDTSREAIERLKEMNIEVIMMTGDNTRTAEAIAKEVGIDRVIAEVLPEGKAEEIKKLQNAGKKVVMVGDGINDAPALAIADIGMAIGTGADVAMEAADITLIRGDLNSIADSIYMSQKTIRNIRQNLFWAFAYNTLGIPIAAAGFLAPWVAGAAMAFSSVSVVLNALRLQRVKL